MNIYLRHNIRQQLLGLVPSFAFGRVECIIRRASIEKISKASHDIEHPVRSGSQWNAHCDEEHTQKEATEITTQMRHSHRLLSPTRTHGPRSPSSPFIYLSVVLSFTHSLTHSPSFRGLFRVIDESVDRRQSVVTRSLFLNGFRFRLAMEGNLSQCPQNVMHLLSTTCFQSRNDPLRLLFWSFVSAY